MTGTDPTERPVDAPNRRRFLVAAAAGTAFLAGCGGEAGPGAANNTTDTTATTEVEMTDTTTAEETETETTTEESGEAMVRVAHLSPDAPNVDVYVDDSAVLEDVPFGAVSDYLALPGGTYSVEITAAGDPDTSVFQGDVPVEAETWNTVAAVGELEEGAENAFMPLVLADQNDPPADDTARVRAVHASPDAPAVDITAGDTLLFDGVAFGEAGYIEVPADDYTIEIRGDTESNDGDVAASFDLSLAGGSVYTAFAVGYLTPDDEPADTPFDLVVTEDAGMMS